METLQLSSENFDSNIYMFRYDIKYIYIENEIHFMR